MDINTVVISCVGLVTTGVLGWLAYFIKQYMKQQDDKNKEQDAELAKVKKEVADLKADLPFIYVTREDHIRTMNNVESKLDKIYDAMLKGGK